MAAKKRMEVAITFRADPETKFDLDWLTESLRISQGSVMRLAIDSMARSRRKDVISKRYPGDIKKISK